MRLRILGTGLAISAAVIATLLAGPANASQGGGDGGGRPCGTGVSTSGQGTLGSPFTLKSKYDDDGAAPGVVVGEEFEVGTPVVGQQWTIQLADNGVVFFDQTVVSTVDGIKGMSMTAAQPGGQVMTAHAVNTVTGETVDGTVTLGPPPAGCGH